MCLLVSPSHAPGYSHFYGFFRFKSKIKGDTYALCNKDVSIFAAKLNSTSL